MEPLSSDTLDVERWRREEAGTTTLAIIAKLEPVGLVFQFLGTFISGLVDPYVNSGARTAVVVIAFAHLPLAWVYARRGGPFTVGGRWLSIPVVQALLMPVLAGLLVEPDRYGVGACTPLCNYAAPTILFLTMYFQVLTLAVSVRVLAETVVVLVPVVTPFVLVLVLNSSPTAENFTAMMTGQLQLIVGYVIGRAAVAVCRVAVNKQVDAQQRSYDEFFNFLHSHVKAGLAAVRQAQPDVAVMLEKLEELEQAVGNRRIEMLFVHEQIPLAVVISERTRAFTGRLRIVESPRIGALTVSRPVGSLVSRGFGDLLKNVLVHGGGEVRIRCVVHGNTISVEVSDSGPGFSPSVLDDPSKSLHRLRRDAIALGGDLRMLSSAATISTWPWSTSSSSTEPRSSTTGALLVRSASPATSCSSPA